MNFKISTFCTQVFQFAMDPIKLWFLNVKTNKNTETYHITATRYNAQIHSQTTVLYMIFIQCLLIRLNMLGHYEWKEIWNF
jgi:hypothetical protein